MREEKKPKRTKNKRRSSFENRRLFLEQATGIEPALSAWEAEVLPLNYACMLVDYSTTNKLCQVNYVNYWLLKCPLLFIANICFQRKLFQRTRQRYDKGSYMHNSNEIKFPCDSDSRRTVILTDAR